MLGYNVMEQMEAASLSYDGLMEVTWWVKD